MPRYLFAFVQHDPTGGSIYPAAWSAMLAARTFGVGSSLTTVLGFLHTADTLEILGVRPATEAAGWPGPAGA